VHGSPHSVLESESGDIVRSGTIPTPAVAGFGTYAPTRRTTIDDHVARPVHTDGGTVASSAMDASRECR
jgi:hypothetical protein